MILFNLLAESNESAGTGSPTMWIILVLLVVMLGVMMFTSSRANKKRQKEAEEKLNNLRVGDRVKTIGGICGIIVEIDDSENTFVLETGKENSGNFIKFDKIAVYQSAHPEEAQPDEEPVAETPEEEPVAEAEEASNETAAEDTETAEVPENAEETAE